MAEIRDFDASIRWFNAIVVLTVGVAMIAIAYVCDRAYRRWLREQHPLAGPRARVVRVKTDYRERRAGVSEIVQFIGEVLDEVARVRSSMRDAS
jgi:hypothetical protein